MAKSFNDNQGRTVILPDNLNYITLDTIEDIVTDVITDYTADIEDEENYATYYISKEVYDAISRLKNKN